MDSIDKRTPVNGYPGVDYKLPITNCGAEPRCAPGGPLGGNEWAHHNPRGGYIWRVTYVNAGCGGGGETVTALFDSASDFRSFLERLGSNGSTVISAEHTSVAGWAVQQ